MCAPACIACACTCTALLYVQPAPGAERADILSQSSLSTLTRCCCMSHALTLSMLIPCIAPRTRLCTVHRAPCTTQLGVAALLPPSDPGTNLRRSMTSCSTMIRVRHFQLYFVILHSTRPRIAPRYGSFPWQLLVILCSMQHARVLGRTQPAGWDGGVEWCSWQASARIYNMRHRLLCRLLLPHQHLIFSIRDYYHHLHPPHPDYPSPQLQTCLLSQNVSLDVVLVVDRLEIHQV